MKRSLWLSILALALLSSPASAQQALTGSNTIQYDFADFAAAGFAPTPATGQLDSDEWVATRVLGMDFSFGETSANMDFANGPSAGGETEGGIWAFSPVPAQCGSGNQTMLGVQPSNMTFSPGSFQLRVQNDTGAPLTEVHLQYAFAWFNDAGRSMEHTLRVAQVDGTGAETGSVDVAALTVQTPIAADGVPAWDGQCQSTMIDLSSIPIANGDNFVIVFDVDDGEGMGSRDELAIGEVQVATMSFGDAGPMTTPDAGVDVADASVDLVHDSGPFGADAGDGNGAGDAGIGGGDDGGSDSGCGCSTGSKTPAGPLGLVLFGLAIARLRRRGQAS